MIRKLISPFNVQASMTVKENELFQKKTQTGGAEDIFFEALPPIPLEFIFLTISTPGYTTKFC